MTWLLAWLWQGIAMAIAVGLLLRVARHLNAATRHIVWWTTLGGVLALPLILAAEGHRPVAAVARPDALAAAPSFVVPVVIPALPDWAVSIAIGAWLGFVVIRLGRVAESFRALGRLKAGCTPLGAEREHRLVGWMSARREGRRAVLMLSDDVALPSALGLGRPVIAVPRGLAGELTDRDLDRVVLHEWAHLRRGDDWLRLAQALIESVAGLHPAVWWIGRMIDVEREVACDDLVVTRTGQVHGYASCLARVAERSLELSGSQAEGRRLLAPGVTGGRRQLRCRISRLLDKRLRRRPWPLAVSLGVGALATGTALAVVAPLTAVVVLVDAASDRAIAQTSLMSRPLVTGSAWAVPRVVSVRVSSASVARQVSGPDPSGPWLPDLAESFPAPTDVPAFLPPVEALLQPTPASVLTATPIVFDDTRPLPNPAEASRGTASGEPARSPWPRVAQAGSTVGAGAKAAGGSTAGFFARVSSSVARAF